MIYEELEAEFSVLHIEPQKDNYCFVGVDDITDASVHGAMNKTLCHMRIPKVRMLVCPMHKVNDVLQILSRIPRRWEVNFRVDVFWFFVGSGRRSDH